jgi:PHP family Zn ribbon phosphoesterase
VPWCEECSRYFTPNSVNEDGTCPSCGDTIQLPADADELADTSDEKTPWHFKLMVVTITVYLGWRLVQVVQNVL